MLATHDDRIINDRKQRKGGGGGGGGTDQIGRVDADKSSHDGPFSQP